MCQTVCPPIHWSEKYRPASVRFTAYSRQTEAGGGASAHLEALRGVGVDQGTIRVPGAMGMAIASTCPLAATDNAQGSQARLGPRLMPPQSQLLAYGPASPVNKSVELALRSRTSPTRRPVMCAAPRKRPRTGPHASMACRAMLASGKGF